MTARTILTCFGVAALLHKTDLPAILAAMKTSDVTDKLQDFQKRASETARNACQTTDEYVHDNVWTSVAFAAVLGCVLGFILSRGRD